MFTGIIEATGEIIDIAHDRTNVHFAVRSTLAHELRVDQSISHNGVCLTIVKTENDTHWVTAISETMQRSNLAALRVGDIVNLERCMKSNGRFDGHIVQGHVDQVATCTAVHDKGGSWQFDFEYDPATGHVTVEKGSICVDGVSLTCFNSRHNGFSVAIIPYTYEYTGFRTLRPGAKVNLEFDIIGKYVQRLLNKTMTPG